MYRAWTAFSGSLGPSFRAGPIVLVLLIITIAATPTAAQTASHAGDRAALVALYNATDGPSWHNNDNWLSDKPLSAWHGVMPDHTGRVGRLSLGDNGLTGTMPPELGALSHLTELDLRGNRLSGPVPSELGNLTDLRKLNLSHNRFGGELPRSLTGLSRMSRFEFGDNEGLCAPRDAIFRGWLVGVAYGWGPVCLGPADRAALAALYEATDGPNWANDANWLSDKPLSTWYGVSTDEVGRVWKLSLPGNQLSGHIPPEIEDLVNLEELDLSRNRLSGRIPSELAGLGRLERLYLVGNELSGPIPPELGRSVNLVELDLGRNQLSGVVPPELGSLADLVLLYLDGNDLSGPIPTELGGLISLKDLDLRENRLSGEVPAELGGMVDLEWLDLEQNQLSGELPHSLTALSALRGFAYGDNRGLCAPHDTAFREWLDHGVSSDPFCNHAGDLAALAALYVATGGANWANNTNWLSYEPFDTWFGVDTYGDGRVTGLYLADNALTGRIPPELGRLGNLTWWLDLSGNELTGSIPSELGDLVNLEDLDLSGNRLSGRIPSELGNLGKLNRLYLDGNELSGPIPSDLGGLANLRRLDISSNQFSGELPPSLTELSALQEFSYGDNRGLCVPGTAAFREWVYDVFASDPICNHAGDLAVLGLLYAATGGSNWANSDNWLSDEPFDVWSGVTMEYGRVTGLSLADNGLTGKIPPELGNLVNLTSLDLSGNRLSGRVPPEIGSLSSLTLLVLDHNQLSGELPGSLTQLSALGEFHYGGNAGLCAPADDAFRRWLSGIADSSGPVCGAPTPAPTATPTPAPTATPTPAPTAAPTPAPTAAPTPAPTAAPTRTPTAAPTPASAPTAVQPQAPTDTQMPTSTAGTPAQDSGGGCNARAGGWGVVGAGDVAAMVLPLLGLMGLAYRRRWSRAVASRNRASPSQAR